MVNRFCYWLVKINEIIELNILDNKKFIDKVSALNFLSEKISLNNIDLSEVYMKLYIKEAYDIKDNDNESISKKTLEEIIKGATLDIDLYYAILIADLLNIELDKKLVIDSICKFETSTGGYAIRDTKEFTNIYSTYRMINILLLQDIDLTDVQKQKFKKYLDLLEGKWGGYFVCNQKYDDYLKNYNENLTIQSCYYGDELNMLLSRQVE